MQLEMSAEEASLLVALLPPAASEPGSGIVFRPAEYDGGEGDAPPALRKAAYLEVPTAFEQQAAQIVKGGVASMALASAKLALKYEINAKRDALLAGGYRHNFGAAAGIRTLDTRDERDAVNWLGLRLIVERMFMAGAADTAISIRDAANATFSASAQTVGKALDDMAGWQGAVLARSWALKDAVAGATDQASLGKIDTSDGWPE